jgi:hypothetical protein
LTRTGDPYIDDSLEVMGGVHPWGKFLQYTVEAPAGIEDPNSKLSNADSKAFLNAHRVTAAGFLETFPDLTSRMIQRASRVMQAFDQVLENPEAAEALSHPALKPLLDLAGE